jgi:hypothetical protein
MRLLEGSTQGICTECPTSISLGGIGQRNAEVPCWNVHYELSTTPVHLSFVFLVRQRHLSVDSEPGTCLLVTGLRRARRSPIPLHTVCTCLI